MGGGTMRIDLSVLHPKPSSSSSSSSFNPNNFPVLANHSTATAAPFKQSLMAASSSSCTNETSTRVVSVNRNPGNLDFGPVPSLSEVETAVAALQNFIQGISCMSGPQLKWLQPLLGCSDLRALISQGSGRVYDAFRLLVSESSVKKLVVSLSSDKAVWDAIMSNEMVRKLRESPELAYPAANGGPKSCDDEADHGSEILRWILDITRAKVMQLIDKFQSLVNEVFHSLERKTEPVAYRAEEQLEIEEKVRSSLLLSVIILLIVIVARAQNTA